MYNDFIPRLDFLMEQKKTTYKELVAYLGINKNNVTKWRQGQIPSILIFSKIADFLDVSIDYLATGQEQAIPPEDIQFYNEYKNLPSEYQEIIQHNISQFSKLCNK